MKLKPFPFATIVCMIGWSSLLFSCKEFIEPSIAKKLVVPEAPSDNFQSTKYSVNFWWNGVEDALSYRLQIVTPGFDDMQSLVMDTLVKTDKFTALLEPGNYQWRVRGENGSSQTAYSEPRSFSVVQTSLTEQTPVLSSPANNTLTNSRTVLLKWADLFGATNFQVEIDTNNFADESKLVYNQVIPGQQLTYTFPKEQVYAWRIKAKNDAEQSKWSAINYITFDATPPGKVTGNSPAKNKITSLPVLLQWNAVAGASNYKLYIFKADSVTNFNSTFPLLLNTTSYSFNAGSSGDTIYWKVTAIDAAGNEGPADLYNFTLQ